jgi:hypothetical protein
MPRSACRSVIHTCMARAAATMLGLAMALPLHAQESLRTCTGSVFEDRDGDGRRGPGEPGLPRARVSDGMFLARTDPDGRYLLDARDGYPLFVVKPAGYDVPRRADGLPGFWHAQAAPGSACPDFALVPSNSAPNRSERLRVLIFADPQAGSDTEVSYYARDVVETALRKGAIDMPHGFGKFYFQGGAGDLGLTLGDIADDDLSLYPVLTAATTRLGVPWLHLPGNHDLDPGAVDDAGSLATYRRHFGPDTYAWEEPEASFVLLDDVVALPGQSPGYTGGLREDQFAFLEAYLPGLPRERLLVVALHIPLFEAPGRDSFRDPDRARLFALLRDFPRVLVLSGHGHVQRHVFHGADDGWTGAAPLHEYHVGAASGAFWSGVADPAGIPDATMADGTPNGHAVLEVRAGGDYALSWLPARLGEDDPASTRFMHLHAPRVLRRGAYPAFGVYANVYMGLEDTRVEYRVDGGPWQPMRRVERPDPRLLAENVRDDLAAGLRGFDRSPEAEPSPHLWRGTLPTDLPAGGHLVEVRAFDRWHGEQRAATRYRLDEAESN